MRLLVVQTLTIVYFFCTEYLFVKAHTQYSYTGPCENPNYAKEALFIKTNGMFPNNH